MCAVLCRAVLDSINNKWVRECPRQAAKLRKWLKSADNKLAYSFAWLCEQVGVEPEQLRAVVARARAEDSERQKLRLVFENNRCVVRVRSKKTYNTYRYGRPKT